MKKSLMALVIALLIPILSVQPASADKSRGKIASEDKPRGKIASEDKPRGNTSAVAWSQLTASTQVWILDNQIHAYECLARPTRATLFLQSPTGWVEAARTVAALDPKLCPTISTRYAAKYEFLLTVNGQQPFPVAGSHAKLLLYQITYTEGLQPRSGVSAVYEGLDEASEDQLDGKLPGINVNDKSEQQAQTLVAPTSVQSKPSATPLPSATSSARTIAGWKGCTFNGVRMFGRVKVVSVGARFKIRFVGSKAALRVKGVTHLAKKCGEWQFVSAAPAFTVEIVRAGEDFTVSLGAAHPGVTK